MSDTCPDCGFEVPLSNHKCPVCQSTGIGFPNVRMATRPSEISALQRRVTQAETSAAAHGKETRLAAFIAAVNASSAVMNRFLGPLSAWMTSASPLFHSYHRQVQEGRVPNGTEWDEQRAAAEAAINPYCYTHLNFAALSLNGKGMTYYGPYTVTLKERTISARSSVFEENAFYFNQHHNVIAGTSPPQGYRAIWDNRGKLAAAKLYSKLIDFPDSVEFADLLMETKPDAPDCDFVEVHIFESIHKAAIERISGPEPARRADKALWRQVKREVRNLPASLEVTA